MLGAARGESWRRCNRGCPEAESLVPVLPAPLPPCPQHLPWAGSRLVAGEPVTPCDKEPGQSGGGSGSQSERAWPPQRRRVTYQQECWARGHPVGPWLTGVCWVHSEPCVRGFSKHL